MVIYKTFAEIEELQLTNYTDFHTFDLGLRMLGQFKMPDVKIFLWGFEILILNCLTNAQSN